jgi:hypothetical protein
MIYYKYLLFFLVLSKISNSLDLRIENEGKRSEIKITFER